MKTITFRPNERTEEMIISLGKTLQIKSKSKIIKKCIEQYYHIIVCQNRNRKGKYCQDCGVNLEN